MHINARGCAVNDFRKSLPGFAITQGTWGGASEAVEFALKPGFVTLAGSRSRTFHIQRELNSSVRGPRMI
jgi:hypothetical protein